MELKNIHNYEEFRNMKLNEGLFNWLSKIFKGLGGAAGKLLNNFSKAISKETNVAKIHKDVETLINTNVTNTEKLLRNAKSAGDVEKILTDNFTLIYGGLTALNNNKVVTDKINLGEVLKDPKLVRVFKSDPNKMLGNGGNIENYIKGDLIPFLKKNAGVLESFLFEAETTSPDLADSPTDTTSGTPSENPGTPSDAEQSTDTEQPKAEDNKEQPPQKVDTSNLKAGDILTYKNKNGEEKKAVVLAEQPAGLTAGNVYVDSLNEGFALPIANITNSSEPDPKYLASIKKMSTNALNWYKTYFITPIHDALKQSSGNSVVDKSQKSGDLSTYKNPSVTEHPETVAKMGDEIKTMSKDQLKQTRKSIADIKGIDPEKGIGFL